MGNNEESMQILTLFQNIAQVGNDARPSPEREKMLNTHSTEEESHHWEVDELRKILVKIY